MSAPIRLGKVDDLWVVFQDGRRCASAADHAVALALAVRLGDRRRKQAAREKFLFQRPPAR